MENISKRIKDIVISEQKERLFKRIVLIHSTGDIFPKKTNKIELIVDKIENYYLKTKLKEDFTRYKSAIKNSSMTTLKNLSKKYSIDLCKLNGYDKYVCDTEDVFLDEIIEKLFNLYLKK